MATVIPSIPGTISNKASLHMFCHTSFYHLFLFVGGSLAYFVIKLIVQSPYFKLYLLCVRGWMGESLGVCVCHTAPICSVKKT